jgi:flagellar motility protein MotE (MotC chaperone)
MKMNGYQKFFQEAKKTAAKSAPKVAAQPVANSVGRAATSSKSPEDMVREHLANRMQTRRREKRATADRRSRKAPVFAILLLVCALAAGTVVYLYPEALDDLEIPTVTKLFPSIKVGFFGSAVAATGNKSEAAIAPTAEKVAAPDAAIKSTSGGTSNGEKVEAVVDIKAWTQEELSFFKKLNERKAELDRREAEIAKLEEELQKQKDGIEERIQQLEAMRKQISETLKGRVEQDQEKVAKLVDVYSNMKPSQASRVIETLNEELAVTILDRMKKKNAAEILNTMSAGKARKLSEMLTGYRQPASTEDKGDEKSESGSPN